MDLVLVTDGSEVASDAVYQSAWNGLAQYGDESGLKYEAMWVPAGRTTEDYENTIKEAAQKGASVIVCAGTSMSRAVYDAQRDWKDVRFLLLEANRSVRAAAAVSAEIQKAWKLMYQRPATCRLCGSTGRLHAPGLYRTEKRRERNKVRDRLCTRCRGGRCGSGTWRKQHHAGLYVSEKQQRITVVFGKNQKLVW